MTALPRQVFWFTSTSHRFTWFTSTSPALLLFIIATHADFHLDLTPDKPYHQYEVHVGFVETAIKIKQLLDHQLSWFTSAWPSSPSSNANRSTQPSSLSITLLKKSILQRSWSSLQALLPYNVCNDTSNGSINQLTIFTGLWASTV